jgi:hypothetical protein
MASSSISVSFHFLIQVFRKYNKTSPALVPAGEVPVLTRAKYHLTLLSFVKEIRACSENDRNPEYGK